MNGSRNGTPDGWYEWEAPGEPGAASAEERYEQEDGSDETIERGLARYVFVREEREGEIRLVFRDVPAADIAGTFRAAGARLISLTGERVSMAPTHGLAPDVQTPEEPAPPAHEGSRRRRKGKPGAHGPAQPPGELVLVYFYAHRDIVYTVRLVLSSGVAQSIASVYPGARLLESEVQQRLGAPFADYRL